MVRIIKGGCWKIIECIVRRWYMAIYIHVKGKTFETHYKSLPIVKNISLAPATINPKQLFKSSSLLLLWWWKVSLSLPLYRHYFCCCSSEWGNNSCIHTMREQLKMKSEFWMIISLARFEKWLWRIFYCYDSEHSSWNNSLGYCTASLINLRYA